MSLNDLVMTLRNRHPLSSSFSTTTSTFFIYHFLSPHRLYEKCVSSLSHSVTGCVRLLIWLACEIGHNARMMWSDKLAIQKTGRGRRRESDRGNVFPERNIDLIISSFSSSSSFPQTVLGERGWVTKTGRLKESEGDREKETDKGMMAPRQCSLCQAHSSALYNDGTGNRLIIYPHILSSGVAPRHSIITTSAQAAVKHFSQQALKMLYLSIWNAHPSCSSSSLSITSY